MRASNVHCQDGWSSTDREPARLWRSSIYFHSEDAVCDDDLIPDYKLPIETRLVRQLRRWQATRNDGPPNEESAEHTIQMLLESFICGCLEYDATGDTSDWWPDGVIYLQIQNRADQEFSLLGVTWIGGDGIAPFEFEVWCDPDCDTHFTRCIFRIGARDDRGRAVVEDSSLAVERVLAARPRFNRDWAMAVELSLPTQDETET